MKRSISAMACLAMASLIIACGTGPAAPSVVTTPTGPASTASGLPGTPAPTATAIASETTGPSASASPAGPTPTPTAVAPAGLIWTRIDDASGFENAKFFEVASQPGSMVVLGARGDPFDFTVDYGGAAAWYSADGEAWIEAALPGASDAVPTGVTPFREGFVAVGYTNSGPFSPPVALVWTSPDGQAWTAADPPTDARELRAVIQTGTGIAAVGQDSRSNAMLWQSDDGVTWQPSTIAEEGEAHSVAATDDGVFLVFGRPYNVPRFEDLLWRSEDGEAWDPVSLPAEGENVVSVASRGDGFLLSTYFFGADYKVWSSDDGMEWDQVLTGTSGSFHVGQGGPGFVAIDRETLWTSSDGVTWSEGDHTPFGVAAVDAVSSIADGGALVAGYIPAEVTNLVVWVGRPAP